MNSYDVVADSEVSSISVTPTTSHSAATVAVNGGVVISGTASPSIALATGNNTVTVLVRAENGSTTRTYTLSVYRLSNDASLSGLSLSVGVLEPSFSAGQLDYTVEVDYAVDTITVMPVTSDANASVTVNGDLVASGSASTPIALAVGSNMVTVIVTAEDSKTTSSYTLTVTRLNNDASLSALTLSVGELDQMFQSTLFSYTATVGFTQTEVQVAAVTVDPNASIFINGMAVASGVESDVIALDEGLNTITVTVTAEDGITNETYTIDLTRQSASNFAQQAYIKASNAEAMDKFGNTVALDGDTLAVGAPAECSAATGVNGDQMDNSACDSGAVYIFIRDAAGTWSQQAYLKASNPEQFDVFGDSISLFGDTVAVGAILEDSAATGIDGNQSDNSAIKAGAVYIFTRDASGTWSQQAYLKASNTDAGDRFGRSVSIYGETLAVGAYLEDSAATGINGDQTDNSAVQAGAVYVFTRDAGGTWSQQAYLKASTISDEFGWSVSLFGDTLAVGAPVDDGAGAVFVFTRDGFGTWSQQANLTASNAGAADNFGHSVSLYGDTLAASAIREDSAATGINGGQSDNSAVDSGAVYVFTRDGSGTWTQQAYLKASNPDQNDIFGRSISLFGDTLAVGAQAEDSSATGVNGNQMDNSASSAGAVYVFTRDATGNWTQQAYLKASNTDAIDQFSPTALSGDTLAVGAVGEGSAATGVNGDQTDNSAGGAGAVYVFE